MVYRHDIVESHGNPMEIPWKSRGRATAPLPLLFLAQARGMGAERARGLAAAS